MKKCIVISIPKKKMSPSALEYVVALLACFTAFFKNRHLFFKFKCGDSTELTVDFNEESDSEKSEKSENEENYEDSENEENEKKDEVVPDQEDKK